MCDVDESMKLRLFYFTFPDWLEKMRHELRDTTEKIGIEMKEVKETHSSLTTKVKKSTDKG